MRILRFPWHPYLFGLFPVLFLWVQNAGHVPWQQVPGPAVVTVVVIGILSLLLNLAIRDLHKSAMVMSVVVLWFFSWGHIPEALEKIETQAPYLAAALALALVAFLLTIRARLDKATVVANQIAAVLVVLQVGMGGWALAQRPELEPIEQAPIEAPPVEGRLPNIFYIVPDGYARADVLKHYYNYDNSEFLEYLRATGFYIADSSHSNYSQTQLSVTSALNMDLVQNLGRFTPRSHERLEFKPLLEENRLFQFLQQYDYTIVQFYTPFDLVLLRNADRTIQAWHDLSEFTEALIGTTPLEYALQHLARYRRARERILFTLERLAELDDVPEPYFVLAHVLCPHPPFLWDADGNEVQPDRPFSMADGSHYVQRGGTQREYIVGYREQLHVFNGLLKQTIDRILESPQDTPPVIILQGDHGPGSRFHQIRLQLTDVRERFSILNAYYLPGIDSSGLYPSITPVNSFRLVLNAYFGTGLPRVEDRSFYSPSYYFLNLTDVTTQLLDSD